MAIQSRDGSISLWPNTLAPLNMTVGIDRPLFKGPKPLSGREQIVAHSAGGWIVNYDSIPIYGSKFLTFRAIWLDIAANGLAVYIKPEFNTYSLANRTGMSSDPGDCKLAASCAQNATTLTVTNSSSYPVLAGDYIEIAGRLHIVKSIGGSTWTIWPPTRMAYDNLQPIQIYDPRLKAYLQPDSRGYQMTLDMGRVSRMSLDFIEANW